MIRIARESSRSIKAKYFRSLPISNPSICVDLPSGYEVDIERKLATETVAIRCMRSLLQGCSMHGGGRPDHLLIFIGA